MKKKLIVITAIVLIALPGLAMVGPIVSNVERPDYDVVSSVKNIEIRQYAPMVIAEVGIRGEREKAIGEGFRLLADYIFGNNRVQQDIAMTAPVQQQANRKIAMTAPVQQQASNNMWKVSFVMPSEYSIDNLPKPNNQQVILREIPEKKYIAVRFSGINSNENIAQHEQKLVQHIEANQIQVIGAPKYAFYNPPWTLPFMRRNEIMIEIDDRE